MWTKGARMMLTEGYDDYWKGNSVDYRNGSGVDSKNNVRTCGE